MSSSDVSKEPIKVGYKSSKECSNAVVKSSSAHADCSAAAPKDQKKSTRKCCSSGNIFSFCMPTVDDDDENRQKINYHEQCLDVDDRPKKSHTDATIKSSSGFLGQCLRGTRKLRKKICPRQCTTVCDKLPIIGNKKKRKRRKRMSKAKATQLSKPRNITQKYDPNVMKQRPVGYVQPSALSYQITARMDDLALPTVRRILVAKKIYSHTFDEERQKILSQYAEQSFNTEYSKFSNARDPALYSERVKKLPPSNEVSQRLHDLALANVRAIKYALKRYTNVLKRKNRENLESQLKSSLSTIYSKSRRKMKSNASKLTFTKKPKKEDSMEKNHDTTRIRDLAFPRLRHVLYSKSHYRNVLDEDHMVKLTNALNQTLMTQYSKMAKLEMPPEKERTPKWTEEDWKRYIFWMSTRDCWRYNQFNTIQLKLPGMAEARLGHGRDMWK